MSLMKRALIYSIAIIAVFAVGGTGIAFVQSRIVVATAPHNTYRSPIKAQAIDAIDPSSLRQSSSTPAASHLLFVGDIMLSRTIGQIMQERNDYTYPFERSAAVLRNADITFANLESVIASSTTGVDQHHLYSFRADPKVVQGLKDAGIDVVSVANNHVYDYGAAAYAQSMRLLKKAGIAYVGGGQDFTEAHTPVIFTTNGQRVAYLGYSQFVPGPHLIETDSHPALANIDLVQMKSDIEAARKEADIVVVSFHWGTEYQETHNAFQEQVAHAAIDDGANLVIGHHPHVIEETEQYNGGYIAYSLGNFIFDQDFDSQTAKSEGVLATAQGGKIINVQLLPIKFTPNFQPYFVSH